MASLNQIVKTLRETIDGAKSKKPSPYDTPAQVIRVEDGIAWVHIPGGVDETPVKLTVNAVPGDEVQIRVGGGSAWIVGNASAPPTDDSTATYAYSTAIYAGDTAASAQTTADNAEVTAASSYQISSNTLIYDHDYYIENGIAYFTAYLYRGGIDVKLEFDPSMFTWYYKTEDNVSSYIGNGYTCWISLTDMGYGGHIIGHFIPTTNAQLQTSDGSALANSIDQEFTARTTTSDGAVRINDLTVATAVYPSDKILVSGTSDEHLVAVQTLQDYLEANISKPVRFNTTYGWDTEHYGMVAEADTLYVYTDHSVDSQGNIIAGIKVGDGMSYLIDMPFTDKLLTEHISDQTVHITQAEREFWNNKVRCYMTGASQLVFTTL